MSCPRGQIRKSAYRRSPYRRSSGVRVAGTYVPSTCIKNRGKGGNRTVAGPKLLPPLRKGTLGQFGYNTSESTSERHRALDKAVSALGSSVIIKKINAVRVLTSGLRGSHAHRVYNDDLKYVQDKYETMVSGRRRSKSSRRSSRRMSGGRRY